MIADLEQWLANGHANVEMMLKSGSLTMMTMGLLMIEKIDEEGRDDNDHRHRNRN